MQLKPRDLLCSKNSSSVPSTWRARLEVTALPVVCHQLSTHSSVPVKTERLASIKNLEFSGMKRKVAKTTTVISSPLGFSDLPSRGMLSHYPDLLYGLFREAWSPKVPGRDAKASRNDAGLTRSANTRCQNTLCHICPYPLSHSSEHLSDGGEMPSDPTLVNRMPSACSFLLPFLLAAQTRLEESPASVTTKAQASRWPFRSGSGAESRMSQRQAYRTNGQTRDRVSFIPGSEVSSCQDKIQCQAAASRASSPGRTPSPKEGDFHGSPSNQHNLLIL